MTSEPKPLGPVVIGGVGGSGTRVVAQFLKDFRFYIGNDLNYANDNLWFAFLFQRPNWFREASQAGSSEILRALRIFEKLMGGIRPSFDDWMFLARAFPKPVAGLKRNAFALRWRMERGLKIAFARGRRPSKYLGWGWKAPISHMYLPYLAECFPGLKYIHVIRHGLDMAFSSNQGQLRNWGGLLGVRVPGDPALLPQASLKYWVAANRRATELGEKLLGRRFLLLNFDELCREPLPPIRSLVEFVGVEPNGIDLERIRALVKVPASLGRYKNADLRVFHREDMQAVQEFGFTI